MEVSRTPHFNLRASFNNFNKCPSRLRGAMIHPCTTIGDMHILQHSKIRTHYRCMWKDNNSPPLWGRMFLYKPFKPFRSIPINPSGLEVPQNQQTLTVQWHMSPVSLCCTIEIPTGTCWMQWRGRITSCISEKIPRCRAHITNLKTRVPNTKKGMTQLPNRKKQLREMTRTISKQGKAHQGRPA